MEKIELKQKSKMNKNQPISPENLLMEDVNNSFMAHFI